jgi:DNA-binding XRE family transcriptional regulator
MEITSRSRQDAANRGAMQPLCYHGGMQRSVPSAPALAHLRALRRRAALSQRDLAKLAGVAHTTIVRLEAGDPNIRPSTVRKLAGALKVKPADLMDD